MNKTLDKTSQNCSLCDYNNIFYCHCLFDKYIFYLTIQMLFDFKMHLHYRIKHKKQYLKLSGITKRILWLPIAFILDLLILIILAISYPFWLIHEHI